MRKGWGDQDRQEGRRIRTGRRGEGLSVAAEGQNQELVGDAVTRGVPQSCQ